MDGTNSERAALIDAILAQWKFDDEIQRFFPAIYGGGWESRVALREFYPLVFENGWDPYPGGFDWHKVMQSPAECLAAQVIRPTAMKMWPQYPVGKYFVDFGDPWKKIAIEVDGREWHDSESDSVRDRELQSMGWTVYRVSGVDVYRRMEGNDNWLEDTIEGLVVQIGKAHYQ